MDGKYTNLPALYYATSDRVFTGGNRDVIDDLLENLGKKISKTDTVTTSVSRSINCSPNCEFIVATYRPNGFCVQDVENKNKYENGPEATELGKSRSCKIGKGVVDITLVTEHRSGTEISSSETQKIFVILADKNNKIADTMSAMYADGEKMDQLNRDSDIVTGTVIVDQLNGNYSGNVSGKRIERISKIITDEGHSDLLKRFKKTLSNIPSKNLVFAANKVAKHLSQEQIIPKNEIMLLSSTDNYVAIASGAYLPINGSIIPFDREKLKYIKEKVKSGMDKLNQAWRNTEPRVIETSEKIVGSIKDNANGIYNNLVKFLTNEQNGGTVVSASKYLSVVKHDDAHSGSHARKFSQNANRFASMTHRNATTDRSPQSQNF